MATQHVNCSYQEIIDLHTESDTVSVVGIHTPTGDVPKQLFSGFYKQFKKFKYNGCSIALVPAARLPADPLQVSYEAGEPTIDPRDMLNPIMFHGCHGNDMGSILNSLYSYGSVNPPVVQTSSSIGMTTYIGRTSSTETAAFIDSGENMDTAGVATSLYYKALTDNTWMKAHPQKGFRKSGLRPLVYNLATTHQILNNHSGGGLISPSVGEMNSGTMQFGSEGNMGPALTRDNGSIPPSSVNTSTVGTLQITGMPAGVNYDSTGTGFSDPYNTTQAVQFLTNKLTGLGWLDTYNVIGANSARRAQQSEYGTVKNTMAAAYGMQWTPANLPRVYMGMMMLPPAYKTEQYFRLVINHNFSFKGFRGVSMQNHDVVEILEAPSYFDGNAWNGGNNIVYTQPHADATTTAGSDVKPLN